MGDAPLPDETRTHSATGARGTTGTGNRTRTRNETRTRAEIESHWQDEWDRLATFRARDDGSAERRYLLTMFPYPSGDLHMGHGEVFALEDVLARYWRLRGFDVLNPIGWDSFGLPAENAAIRHGESPVAFTEANIAQQAATARRYAVSFDWSRLLRTSDPGYYRWNQWLFARMVERGLAYRAPSSVVWCPQDQTVLANEQVVAGRCERCGTAVTRRELVQWFFRITAYADRLLDDMALLEDAWPERVLTMQRHWIGRSAGATISFAAADGTVEVFTTRPDTLPGVTFLAVAPDGDVATRLCAPERRAALDAYRREISGLLDVERQRRGAAGFDLGATARHPGTGAPVPVWAADYVLADYGTGVVMGVPARDERDAAFAAAHGLAVRDFENDDGVLGRLVEAGVARTEVRYRLRDWLVSRQRYWGTPIPVVHCPRCGEVLVPDDQLPVTLPELRGEDLLPRGESPLAGAADWVATTCPRCAGPARRDTDTMDTFVDSSWYFLRFCSPHDAAAMVDPEAARRWLPVDVYVGGVEHAILHLLYSRFVTKVLADLGVVDVVEPFAALRNQGQVVNRGRAMSKSLGNGVDLGEQLDAFGTDAVRLAMVFAGPPADDVDWADVNPAAMQRFLARASRLADDVAATGGTATHEGDGGAALRRVTHRTVRTVEELVEGYRLNVAVARLMDLASAARTAVDSGPGPQSPAVREAVETLAVLLGMFAPYTAEEMWQALGHAPSVAQVPWPAVDESLLLEESTVAVIQVDGVVRDRVTVSVAVSADDLVAAALDRPVVRRWLADGPPTRVVARPPGLVNLVTRERS